ncbi:hypothetical protein [Terrabacter sp. Ter38]|uniref:hypothetical protein n=1 Tax=Terrabacter sp. Ter38 TaxID=2926030 RepID=UPI002117E1C9|nr:hypothetical protein [Terrabacter sp. Ter38]
MAVKWRADPRIEDPIPITKERVAAWVAVVAALALALIIALRGFDVPLSENLHSIVVAATGIACLALGRGVYASALARLDLAQIRRTGRGDLLADVVVFALAAVGGAVLAVVGDPWMWLGCALFTAVAVDQARFVRARRAS